MILKYSSTYCTPLLRVNNWDEVCFSKKIIYCNFKVIVITKHVHVFFLDKPAAVPAAKKAAVDGKLFFVSEPQSIMSVVPPDYLK